MAIFNLVSSSTFHASDSIDSTGLYFLHDTGEVYRGSTKYSKAVITYTGDLPTTPARDTLYVNSTTLAGSIYDGSSWTQVVKPVVSTVAADGTDPVNSTAVIAYVADQLANVTGGSSVVTGVSYDDDTVSLTITDALGETSTLRLDGLAVELAYDSTTQSLTVKDAAGSVLGSAIDLSGLVQTNGSSYDLTAGTVTIALGTGTGITVPISDYVSAFETTYGSESSSTITLSITDNKFKAEAIVATTSGNMLSATDSGLYVAATDTSALQALVTGATADNIATLTSTGQTVDSGVAIGGATLATSATSSVLATEAAVAAAIAAAVSTLEGSISTLSTTVGENTAAITAEVTRAKAAEEANATNIATNATDIGTNATNIATNTAAIATLNGTGTGSVSKTVTDAIAEVVNGAPEDFDTLKEISDWISGHADDASAMNTAISDNTTNIATNTTNIATNAADIATNVTNISTNATNIATNASDIAAEITRAKAAEEANAANISTNATNIATNASDIAAEITRAKAAEAANASDIATNATAISTEQTRAEGAESALSGRLDTLEAIDAVETSDIATSLSSSSTDAEVASAKAVYDAIAWNVID